MGTCHGVMASIAPGRACHRRDPRDPARPRPPGSPHARQRASVLPGRRAPRRRRSRGRHRPSSARPARPGRPPLRRAGQRPPPAGRRPLRRRRRGPRAREPRVLAAARLADVPRPRPLLSRRCPPRDGVPLEELGPPIARPSSCRSSSHSRRSAPAGSAPRLSPSTASATSRSTSRASISSRQGSPGQAGRAFLPRRPLLRRRARGRSPTLRPASSSSTRTATAVSRSPSRAGARRSSSAPRRERRSCSTFGGA